jgi:DNA-binding HxlR family transcriptional regulator
MSRSKLPSIAHIVENCLGCKWTLLVLDRIRAGINRPGRLERSVPGLTAKVLSQRIEKLLRFGLITKTSFPELPPRVEYRLTLFGRRLVRIFDSVQRLREDVDAGAL